MKNILFLLLIAVLLSGCTSSTSTEPRTICDSIKTDLRVPKAIPDYVITKLPKDIPIENVSIYSAYGKDGIYLHWCYDIKPKSNLFEVIKMVQEIIMQVLKIFYQINQK